MNTKFRNYSLITILLSAMMAAYNSYSSPIEDDFKDLEKNFSLLKNIICYF